ncbi:MAG TPA: pilus assembly protein N-terminal domain-containing protein [Candidatus Cybelea sp.]|nr:pilus assembly protein N-terminal domain-containing protein [Candidatus Cybelea sp.]
MYTPKNFLALTLTAMLAVMPLRPTGAQTAITAAIAEPASAPAATADSPSQSAAAGKPSWIVEPGAAPAVVAKAHAKSAIEPSAEPVKSEAAAPAPEPAKNDVAASAAKPEATPAAPVAEEAKSAPAAAIPASITAPVVAAAPAAPPRVKSAQTPASTLPVKDFSASIAPRVAERKAVAKPVVSAVAPSTDPVVAQKDDPVMPAEPIAPVAASPLASGATVTFAPARPAIKPVPVAFQPQPPAPSAVPSNVGPANIAQRSGVPQQQPLAHPAAALGAAPTALTAADRQMALSLNKSQIVRLSRPARDVLVANPAIADVVMRSSEAAFIIGRKVGETNVYFFDAAGKQIDQVDLRVEFDSAAVLAAVHSVIPNEQIDVSTANQSIVLTGSVASAQVAENARQIARQFVADDNSIINMLKIRGQNQVLLRVRVSEMARQIVKELGIGTSAQLNGKNTFNLAPNPLSFINTPFSTATGTFLSTPFDLLTIQLQALEQNGLVKTLAEPNLTAVSGEAATFLVGGEFPVPVPQASGNGTIITITYKQFGIRLTFTPVVMSGNLINLRISTEVSQLSAQGQVNLSGFLIPALSVRRAETVVEMPSGGSIAIAGLLQNDIQNTLNGLPGLKDIPILGALFSSTQFQRQETDLVIAVTPLLVKPVDPNVIAYPTDGFGPASDFDMYLLGRLHATYTKPEPGFPHGQPKGPFGFILE